MSIELGKLDRLESLAHEAIRTAVGVVKGTMDTSRANEAYGELKAAVVETFGDPQTLLNLIQEIRSR